MVRTAVAAAAAALLFATAVPGSAQEPAPAAPPAPAVAAPAAVADRSTPQKAVETFLAAILRSDIAGMVDGVYGATLTPAVRKFEAQIKSEPWPYGRMELTDVSATDAPDGSTTLKFTLKPVGDGKEQMPNDMPRTETLTLRKEGEAWKIVPMPRDELMRGMSKGPTAGGPGIIAMIAALVGSPEVFAEQERPSEAPAPGSPNLSAPARAAVSLSNVRQISTGLMMLVQDYDEKFAVKAATYKKSVMPYVKNEKVFTSPLDKPGTVSYQFNPKLAGVTLAKIKTPARTVMLYEGAWGKPRFRHDGKAVIGFADGHAKLVSAAEAKALRWTP